VQNISLISQAVLICIEVQTDGQRLNFIYIDRYIDSNFLEINKRLITLESV